MIDLLKFEIMNMKIIFQCFRKILQLSEGSGLLSGPFLLLLR